MQEILEIFKNISEIPHCSFETEKLKDYLDEFLQKNGFSLKIDESGNIYALKGEPKICLQAHYDMVCAGSAPKIEIYEDNGFLKARNSTLGADNGMGIAIILKMAQTTSNLEIVLTNNEEVGLLGANNFNEKLKSSYLLNLDSEEDSEVIIGCAGGVDIIGNLNLSRSKKSGKIYEVEISNLPGGHSGIDIAKSIPNAIKELAKFLANKDVSIIDIRGGERRNCIPTSAKATILVKNEFKKDDDRFSVKFLGEKEADVLDQSENILNFLNSFANGVRAYDEKVKITQTSINLAIIGIKDNKFDVECFARSMSNDGVENIEFETITLFKSFKFDVKSENKTAAWKPEVNEFNKDILEFLKQEVSTAKISAIHAGLECGVFIEKDPNIKACSIGPNIYNAHTINECCEIASVEKIYNVVKNIVKKYS